MSLTKSTLSPDQSARKAELEKTIYSALQQIRGRFVEIGKALSEINEAGLYLDDFDTFDAYCRAKWNFSDKRAYQLIAGVEAVENVSTVVEIPNERAARPLTMLEPKAQIRVAKRVAKLVKRTERRVTAKIIEAEVVRELPRGGLAASLAGG